MENLLYTISIVVLFVFIVILVAIALRFRNLAECYAERLKEVKKDLMGAHSIIDDYEKEVYVDQKGKK